MMASRLARRAMTELLDGTFIYLFAKLSGSFRLAILGGYDCAGNSPDHSQ